MRVRLGETAFFLFQTRLKGRPEAMDRISFQSGSGRTGHCLHDPCQANG